MKIEFNSHRREMLLSLTINTAAVRSRCNRLLPPGRHLQTDILL